MRLRIEADGTVDGTKIFDGKTGRNISRDVTKVVFMHRVGEIPQIRLTFIQGRIEGTGWDRRKEEYEG